MASDQPIWQSSGPEIMVTDQGDERAQLQPVPESVGQARRLVRAALAVHAADLDVDVAVLLTSEVVTNALLHARSPMILAVVVGPRTVRVSVHDGSPVSPHLRNYSAMAATGRGLHLVQALASRWGLETGENGTGKWIWFEIAARRGRAAG
jgi:anti-sigma regulatory factor (Ser/Thr protein kinase)